MGILGIFIITILFMVMCIFIGYFDEKKTTKKKFKKNSHIDIPNFIMSKSRRCLNCRSSNVKIESNYKLLNFRKHEKKIRALKCYIKFCHNCGHIEFFSTPIVGNSLKKLYNRPILLSLGDFLREFLKSFLQIFNILKPK